MKQAPASSKEKILLANGGHALESNLRGHGVDQRLDVDRRRGIDAAAIDCTVQFLDRKAHGDIRGAVGLIAQPLFGFIPFLLSLSVGTAPAFLAARAPA